MSNIGDFRATVTNAEHIDHRFQNDNPGQIEIKIEFENADGKGACYKDLSTMKWVTSGKHEGKRACDGTIEDMAQIGIDIKSNPYNISQMIGREFDFYGKETEKYGVKYYLDINNEKKADQATVQRAFQQMMEDMGGTPAPAPAPAPNFQQQPAQQQTQQFVQQPAQQQQQQPNMQQFIQQPTQQPTQQPQANNPAAPQGWV